jgi:hypothetical protein
LTTNIFGFIVPGLLLAIVGNAIARSISFASSRSGKIAQWILPLFGLTVAGQGFIPASMANGEPVVVSWHTRGHLIMSLVSGMAWIVAALCLAYPMTRSPDWRGLRFINLAAIVYESNCELHLQLSDGMCEMIRALSVLAVQM